MNKITALHKQLVRRVDPGLLLILAIATLAAWPLLTRPSMPTKTDAEMHIYRAAVIENAIRGGEFYIRWAPDFYYGHGYPVFNYYSPLSYHIAAYYSIFTGTDAAAGTKFVLVLGVYLGALGMYLFARDRWRSEAGLIAATAWTYAPYVLYIDPYGRGDVPQAFAMAVSPALFWAFDRLRRTGAWRYFMLATLTLTTLILAHPLMALMMYGLLLGFLAWQLFIAPSVPRLLADTDKTPQQAYPLLGIAIAFGLLIAAGYWLPAGFERYAIKFENVGGPGYFDFRNYFLTWSELLRPARPFDLGATEPDFRYNLGLAQWVMAVLGFLTVFSSRLRRIDTLFFAFATVILMYMMTPASEGVWKTVPNMTFFQFPTRFLGPAALTIAPLAGASIRWTELAPGKLARRLVTPVSIGLIMLAAMPLNYPPGWDDFGSITRWRMIEVELAGRALGTTAADDFLPVGVDVVPAPQDGVILAYREGQPLIDKLNRFTLPDGAEVIHLEGGAQYDRYQVTASDPFTFRLYRFNFPGWVARVDGEPVPIETAKPDGFITFPVPAGEHQVEIRLESTPIRRLGIGMTWLGLLMLAALSGWKLADIHRKQRNNGIAIVPLSEGATSFVALALLLFVAFKVASDQLGWFRYHSTGSEVQVAQQQYIATVGDHFEFLGFDLSPSNLRPGGELTATLYWRALETPDQNYQVFVHLLDQQGQLWGQSDKLNPADFPTERWPLDRYVRDRHELTISNDLPPGDYDLAVGLWDAATGQRLEVTLPDGSVTDSLFLPVELHVP